MKYKYYVTLTFFEYWVRVPSFAAWLLMNLPFIDMKVEPQTTNNR